MADLSTVGEKLHPWVKGRSFVLVGDSLASLAREAEVLLALGATKAAVIGDGLGLAEPPTDPRITWRLLDVTDVDVPEGRRRAAAALRALPTEVVAWLDAVDPARASQVLDYSVGFVAHTIAGRRVIGATRPEWIALDDKTSCDGIWQAARVRHAPSRRVSVERDALIRRSSELDHGRGTVWAGDSRDGPNSGAHLTRWIRNADDVDAAMPVFSAHCDRLRVMPFVEGIPCSVHAVVANDGIGVLRPCEIFVFRASESGHFRFAGMATTWDPDDGDRDDMRASARRIAEVLRSRLCYRGTFTLDGVLGEDGFVPTELNPRIGRALRMMGDVIPEAGLVAHTKFLADGVNTGLTVADIERTVLEAVDRLRTMSAALNLPEAPTPAAVDLVFTETGLARVPDDRDPDAVLRCGPAHSYTPGIVLLEAKLGRTPIGPPAGPVVADVFNHTDEWLGVGAGGFDAPAHVR